MAVEPGKTGSWASKKDYSLPLGLLEELRKKESVQELLDRYIPAPTRDTAAVTESVSSEINITEQHGKSAFITALLDEPETLTTNGAPAYTESGDPLVE